MSQSKRLTGSQLKDQFASIVFENMNSTVYQNARNVIERLSYDKEQIKDLARAFDFEEGLLKDEEWEVIEEDLMLTMMAYVFNILGWEYDSENCEWVPPEYNHPDYRRPRVFMTMHLDEVDPEEGYGTLDSETLR